MALRLLKTCSGCPEQYEVFDGDKQVGYIRLRHGNLTVECPDCGGDLVYEASPDGDGEFEDHERDYFLRFAVDAIQRWMGGERPTRPEAPDVQYEIAILSE